MSLNSLFEAHKYILDPQEYAQFEEFLKCFMAYNAHTNLSAIRKQDDIIEKHFIDSLYGASIISEYLKHEKSRPFRLLDIGSGGGFPGIPLKIVLPEISMTLLDSVGKKVRAMESFIKALGLKNISAIQARAEELCKDPLHQKQYHIVVSRATAYMDTILKWATPFLHDNGRIILYKMPSEDEQKSIKKAAKKLQLIQEGELEYSLGGKERILYVFAKHI